MNDPFENFILTASPDQLRAKMRLVVKDILRYRNSLSGANRENRRLQSIVEGAKIHQREMDRDIAGLQGELSAKTQECDSHRTAARNMQTYVTDTLGPALNSTRDALEKTRRALEAKTRECGHFKRSAEQLERVAQQSLPPRLTHKQVIDRHAGTPVNGADKSVPLIPTPLQAQEIIAPKVQTHPTEQSREPGSHHNAYPVIGGSSRIPRPEYTHSPELIDLTTDEPKAAGAYSEYSSNQSNSQTSATGAVTNNEPSDTSVTTFGSSEQLSSEASTPGTSLEASKTINPLKRKAESEHGEPVKKAKGSSYDWIEGSGKPGHPDKKMTDVRGKVEPDKRTSYQCYQAKKAEKEERERKRMLKRQGIVEKPPLTKAKETKSSNTEVNSSTQQPGAWKPTADADGTRVAHSSSLPKVSRVDVLTMSPTQAGAACNQVYTADNTVPERLETTHSQHPETSQGNTMTIDEGEASLTAEIEAGFEAASERDDDAAASQVTENQAPTEAGTMGNSISKESRYLAAFQPAEASDDDMGSLFGDNSGNTALEDVKPEQRPRSVGYTSDLECDFDEEAEKRRFDAARACKNNFLEEKEDSPKKVARKGKSIIDAPPKKRGRPKKPAGEEEKPKKAPAKKASTKRAPAKKPRQSKKASNGETENRVIGRPLDTAANGAPTATEAGEVIGDAIEEGGGEGAAEVPGLWDESVPGYDPSRDVRYLKDMDATSSEEE